LKSMGRKIAKSSTHPENTMGLHTSQCNEFQPMFKLSICTGPNIF
jgi:hypothetical protein